MFKNLRINIICFGLILALLLSGLTLQPSAFAQKGGPAGDQSNLPGGVSRSADQSSGVSNSGGQAVRGRTITRVLARGSPIHGANGMNFGPDGYLYIASAMGGQIVVMEPNSGRIIQRILPASGMDDPDDLAFGPDGSVYWTAFGEGRIGKMAPDGTQSVVTQITPGVNPITFSDDGRLFTALDFIDQGLYEVYLDGTPARLIIEQLGWLNGFDFGPDGLLYGPIVDQAKIVKIDVDTGEKWDVVTGLYGVSAVKFGPEGMMYFTNYPTGQVSRMDLSNGQIEVLATLTPGLDNLAINENGRVFVSSAVEGFVIEIIPNDIGRPVSPGGMIAPGGLAILPGADGYDNIFMGDVWALRQFNGQTGRQLFADRLSFPSIHTVAADGMNLVISTHMANAVFVYDPSTQSIIDARHDFFGPVNAIRFQGDLIVCEYYTHMVIRSSAPGDRQMLITTLQVPLGLAATDDDLWVADWATGDVYQIIQDGEIVSILLATGLDGPEGLAVLPDGNLMVVEAGAGRVSRIDSETGEVTPFVEGLQLGGMHLSGMPGFWIFNGIAVSLQTGTIYVSGDDMNVLYRIDQRP